MMTSPRYTDAERKTSATKGGTRSFFPFMVQPKLTVNQPDDQYEKEADAIADKVMRMGEASVQQNLFFKPAASVQRMQNGQDNEKLQRKELNEGAEVSSGFENYVNGLSGGGQSLAADTKQFFEPRFGHDFSNVRIHTGSAASESAQSINALAYTSGHNIVFNTNQYDPGSESGKRLLGHELTHVVQQTGGAPAAIRRKIEVPAGTTLDTMGFTFVKAGNVYSSPVVSKGSLHNEIFSALLHSSRVFKLAGATTAEVNGNLQKHITSRIGIVVFASKKKYSFGAGPAFKMNPAFWNNDFTVKPGIDKQKAMDDVNVHPKDYAIACLAATTITMEGGSQSSLSYDGSSDAADWVPGDWGYITNTKFTGAASDVGLEGENIIYVGKNLFWGHFAPGNTYKTLNDWMADVKSWNGGAQLEDQRTSPTTGLL